MAMRRGLDGRLLKGAANRREGIPHPAPRRYIPLSSTTQPCASYPAGFGPNRLLTSLLTLFYEPRQSAHGIDLA